jgi:hypothetical protein
MTYIDTDECDDDVAPSIPVYAYMVAVYLCERTYGGPEEGGWYYDAGNLSVEHAAHTRVFLPSHEKAALAYARELNDKLDAEDNAGRPSLSSVLSTGRYQAHVVENFAPKNFPETRPYYS